MCFHLVKLKVLEYDISFIEMLHKDEASCGQVGERNLDPNKTNARLKEEKKSCIVV